MLAEKFFTSLFTLLGKQHRFCLTDWIEDHPFLMETPHCLPVVTLPSAPIAVEREKEKREHHLVYFVFVVVHASILTAAVL